MTPSKELNNLSQSNLVPVSSIKSSMVFKDHFRSSQTTQNQSSFPEVLMCHPSTLLNSGASNPQKSRKATCYSKATSSVLFMKTVCSQTIRSWCHQSAKVESLGLPPPVSTTFTKRFWNLNSTVSRLSTR